MGVTIPKPMSNKRKQSKGQKDTTGASLLDGESGSAQALLPWLEASVAFLVATLIVWSLVHPVDSVSVFTGDAQAQNLLWLVVALCTGLIVWLRGGKLNFKIWEILALCAAGVWLVMVSWQAGSENNARVGWFGFWQVVSLAACYWCISALCQKGPRFRAGLVMLCLVGCIASSVNGLHQLAIGIPRERAEYEKDPETVLQSLGIDSTEGSPSRLRFESRLQSPEPFATFALANSLATLLTAGLVLLVGVAFINLKPTSGDTETKSLKLTQWCAILLCSGLVCLCWFLTRSRTAYIAAIFAIGLGTIGLWRNRSLPNIDRRAWLALGGISLLLGTAAMVWLVRNDELVLTQARLSLGYRVEYWQASLAMLTDHWLTGVGLGNFQAYYPQYKLEVASEEIADPHNWILDVATTLSLPIAVLLIAWVARKLSRILFANESSEESTDDQADRKSLRHFLFGAGIGGCVAFLLTFMLIGVDLEASLIGWLAGGLCGWVLYAPIQRALAIWPKLPLVAAFSMAVCLLASGSWQASGLAVPLLALIAAAQPNAGQVPRKAWLPAFAAASGLVIFVVQSWHPVTTAWTLHQQALNSSSQQSQLLLAASEADQLDSNFFGDAAKSQLVELGRYGSTIRQEEIEPALAGIDEWLAKDQHRFTNWSEAGNLILELLAATGSNVNFSDANSSSLDSFLLAKAILYFSQAVERYPSSVALHAQLAATYALAGKNDEFQAEYEELMRLSDQTPHLDKKLDQQQIFMPLDVVPPTMRRVGQKVVQAEPLLRWLRTQESGP